MVYPRGREPQNFTALRNAERRLKKKDADLSQCIDTRDLLRHGDAVRARSNGMFEVGDTGCVVWPGAVSIAQQVELIGSCLGYHGLSNLDAHYVLDGGASGLFASLDSVRHIARKPGTDDSDAVCAQPLVQEMGRAEQVALLRRLRWISIGQQYDWASKSYFAQSEPMPPDVCALCARLCRDAGLCEDFRAEAGIVNLYQPGDSLTGHVDRSERRMDVPLVSVSLGASCVFVLGGQSRDDEPVALLLHSGDALFLSGRSRLMYHGVPRILGPAEQLRTVEGLTLSQRAAFEVLGNGRININVRQVH